jgi:hypothetical protein
MSLILFISAPANRFDIDHSEILNALSVLVPVIDLLPNIRSALKLISLIETQPNRSLLFDRSAASRILRAYQVSENLKKILAFQYFCNLSNRFTRIWRHLILDHSVMWIHCILSIACLTSISYSKFIWFVSALQLQVSKKNVWNYCDKTYCYIIDLLCRTAYYALLRFIFLS